MEPSHVEEALRGFFAETQRGVVAAYLFGSHGRGEAKRGSDVDVAVLMKDEPEPTLSGLGLGLAGQLEGLLGRPVDVLVLNGARPSLVHQVLRDGRLLLDRDPSLRIRFEVRARNDYFDMLPVLRRYRTPRGDRP